VPFFFFFFFPLYSYRKVAGAAAQKLHLAKSNLLCKLCSGTDLRGGQSIGICFLEPTYWYLDIDVSKVVVLPLRQHDIFFS
jgi:hypothetical protein